MTISEYQKKCFADYKTSIEYPEHYKYLYGNPINVLVPVETPINKIMIVGAYPSAKFFTVNGISDTPLYDNDSPFSSETYFDGSRPRTIPSGKELNDVILKEIGINREDCWITDLVKVFLFKEGHVERYKKLDEMRYAMLEENRSKFKCYAKKSITWLEMEIEIAKPYAIILLGLEVTSILHDGIGESKAKSYMDGNARKLTVGAQHVNSISLPHPGILMKKSEHNPWPAEFENVIAPRAKETLTKLLENANHIV
ncbi:MAG: uracil-DNA glycosylase family protein [Bacteroidota bacterium]